MFKTLAAKFERMSPRQLFIAAALWLVAFSWMALIFSLWSISYQHDRTMAQGLSAVQESAVSAYAMYRCLYDFLIVFALSAIVYSVVTVVRN